MMTGRSEMEEQAYSLKWNPNPPLGVPRLVVFAVAAAVYTIVAWLGVIALPMGFLSVSALYIGIGFITPFVMWFGGWGLVIGAIGGIVGSGILAGMPIALAIPFGLLVEWGTEIPMLVLYRLVAPRFGISSVGRDIFKAKGFVFYLLVVVIFIQLLSALIGNGTLYAFGFIPADAMPVSITSWWIGNMISAVVIGPIILGALTPVVERLGLTVRGIVT
jgi:hypothetical protein